VALDLDGADPPSQAEPHVVRRTQHHEHLSDGAVRRRAVRSRSPLAVRYCDGSVWLAGRVELLAHGARRARERELIATGRRGLRKPRSRGRSTKSAARIAAASGDGDPPAPPPTDSSSEHSVGRSLWRRAFARARTDSRVDRSLPLGLSTESTEMRTATRRWRVSHPGAQAEIAIPWRHEPEPTHPNGVRAALADLAPQRYPAAPPYRGGRSLPCRTKHGAALPPAGEPNGKQTARRTL
jgi:hypothetical protein